MKFQFHIHTRYSRDSLLPLFLLRFACKLQRIDCVCITDHNEIAGAIKCKERYESDRFKVIVGEEIFTSNGEIIGLFLHEKIQKGLSPEETIRQIHAQGGLVIIPHPYEVERGKTVLAEESVTKNVKEIDAMECFNGRNFKAEYSDIQNRLCEKYCLPKILGSDAHTVYEIGYNTMIAVQGAMLTKETFISFLDTASFRVKHMPRAVHYITKAHKFVKLLMGKYRDVR